MDKHVNITTTWGLWPCGLCLPLAVYSGTTSIEKQWHRKVFDQITRPHSNKFISRVRGSMKMGPKENLSTLKNVLWKPVPLQKALWKLAPLQNVLGKFIRKFFCHNFFGKTMTSAGVSWPLSIVSRYHCHGWDDNPKPILLVISRYR